MPRVGHFPNMLLSLPTLQQQISRSLFGLVQILPPVMMGNAARSRPRRRIGVRTYLVCCCWLLALPVSAFLGPQSQSVRSYALRRVSAVYPCWHAQPRWLMPMIRGLATNVVHINRRSHTFMFCCTGNLSMYPRQLPRVQNVHRSASVELTGVDSATDSNAADTTIEVWYTLSFSALCYV